MQSPVQLAKTSGVGATGKQLQPAETLAPKRPCRGGMTHLKATPVGRRLKRKDRWPLQARIRLF